MTSLPPVALDIAPANATPTTDDPQPSRVEADLTAEAEATEPINIDLPVNDSLVPEQSKQANTLLPPIELSQDTSNNGESVAGQNGLSQPGETPDAGLAAIPELNMSLSETYYNHPLMESADFMSPYDSAQMLYNLYGGNMPVPMPLMNEMIGQQPYVELDPLPQVEERQIQAYAKLEFPDGEYFMNTYSIKLGRDLKAAKKAIDKKKRKLEAPESLSEERSKHDNQPVTSESGGIFHLDGGKKKKSRKSRASNKSQSSDSSDKKSRRGSLSYTPGVYPIQAQRADPSDEPVPVDPTSLRPSPHSCPLIGLHPVNNDDDDAADLEVDENGAKKKLDAEHYFKQLSRVHLKIEFNPETSHFDLHVLGRNGCFIADWPDRLEDLKSPPLYSPGTVHQLKHMTEFQVSSIKIKFMLPLVDPQSGEVGIDADEDNLDQLADTSFQSGDYEDRRVFRDVRGKEMNTDHSQEIRADASEPPSSDDEDGSGEGFTMTRGRHDPRRDAQKKPAKSAKRPVHGGDGHVSMSDDSNGVENDEQDDEEEDGEDEESEEPGSPPAQAQAELPRQSIEEDAPPKIKIKVPKPAKPTDVPKRSGPGRPPKNGVRSKREEKELKKKAEEAAAAAAAVVEQPEADPAEKPKKGKVGRPRKHPLPSAEDANKPKRKYTKRQPKEGGEDATEPGPDGVVKKVKKEKPARPARSPSPVYDVSTLTEEQKTKPTDNYVVVIFLAMKASHHEEMGLPQIYNAIKRLYPYFAVCTETKGWESSVRHNLSGNPTHFEKGEKDGKGHMWRLVPGATIDKERKKKTGAEPQYQGQPQNIQQAPQSMQYNPVPYNGFSNPNYQHPGPYPPPPHGYQAGSQYQFMQAQGYQGPPPANSFVPPPGPYHQPIPPYHMPPHPAVAAAVAPTSNTYSSPYGPKPVAASNGSSDAVPQAQGQQPQSKPSPPTISQQPQPQQPQITQAQMSQSQTSQPQQSQQSHLPQPPSHQSPPTFQHHLHATQPQSHHVQNAPPQQGNNQTFASVSPHMQTSSAQHQPSPGQSNNSPVPQPSQVQASMSSQSPSAPNLHAQVSTQVPAGQQQSPPAQAPLPKGSATDPARMAQILNEFGTFLRTKGMGGAGTGSEEMLDTAIAAIRRDGDRAEPDPSATAEEKRSIGVMISALRSAMSIMPGSGLTSVPAQRSFDPEAAGSGRLTPSMTQASNQSNINNSSANGNAVNRPSSGMARPPITNPVLARPPMHTPKRTNSGGPATPGSITHPGNMTAAGFSTSFAHGGPAVSGFFLPSGGMGTTGPQRPPSSNGASPIKRSSSISPSVINPAPADSTTNQSPIGSETLVTTSYQNAAPLAQMNRASPQTTIKAEPIPSNPTAYTAPSQSPPLNGYPMPIAANQNTSMTQSSPIARSNTTTPIKAENERLFSVEQATGKKHGRDESDDITARDKENDNKRIHV